MNKKWKKYKSEFVSEWYNIHTENNQNNVEVQNYV